MNMCDMCWGKLMSNDSIVDRSNITTENGADLEDHMTTIVLHDGDDEAIEDRPIVAISNLSTNLDTEPSGNTKEADEEESEITIANVTNADQCQSPTNKNDSLEELPISESTVQQDGEEQSVPEQSALVNGEDDNGVNDDEIDTYQYSNVVLFSDNLLQYLKKTKDSKKAKAKYIWDGDLDDLKTFTTLVLKMKGKWTGPTKRSPGKLVLKNRKDELH